MLLPAVHAVSSWYTRLSVECHRVLRTPRRGGQRPERHDRPQPRKHEAVAARHGMPDLDYNPRDWVSCRRGAAAATPAGVGARGGIGAGGAPAPPRGRTGMLRRPSTGADPGRGFPRSASAAVTSLSELAGAGCRCRRWRSRASCSGDFAWVDPPWLRSLGSWGDCSCCRRWRSRTSRNGDFALVNLPLPRSLCSSGRCS